MTETCADRFRFAAPDLNLLFLCGGRRVKLLRIFRAALGSAGRIITTDTESRSAASYVADRTYLVPPCRDEGVFVGAVVEICERERIDAVIPLTCAAVRAVPAIRRGTTARIVSGSDEAICVCTDKFASSMHFLACDVATPPVVSRPTALDFPLVHRERLSEGSRSVAVINTPGELEQVESPTGILTRWVAGREFSIDCYKDIGGSIVAIVPRERLRVRAGEVERSVTRCVPPLIEQCRRVVDELDFFGPATVQAIVSPDAIHFTEINLRFGGGVTLSIAAGMDSPTWLAAELSGAGRPAPGGVRWDLGMSRYDEDLYFDADGPCAELVLGSSGRP